MAINDLIARQRTSDRQTDRLLNTYFDGLIDLFNAVMERIDLLPRDPMGRLQGRVTREGAINMINQAGWITFVQPLQALFSDAASVEDEVLEQAGIRVAPPSRQAMVNALNFALGQLDTMRTQMANGVSQMLTTAASVPLERSTIASAIGDITRTARVKAKTIADTAMAGLQREMATNAIQFLPEDEQNYFLYLGPLDAKTRGFCEALRGKAIRQQDIGKLKNGQGLPVPTFAGGFNCRHRLIPITEEIREARDIPKATRADIARANKAS